MAVERGALVEGGQELGVHDQQLRARISHARDASHTWRLLVPVITMQHMLTPPLTRRRVVDLGYVSATACPKM